MGPRARRVSFVTPAPIHVPPAITSQVPPPWQNSRSPQYAQSFAQPQLSPLPSPVYWQPYILVPSPASMHMSAPSAPPTHPARPAPAHVHPALRAPLPHVPVWDMRLAPPPTAPAMRGEHATNPARAQLLVTCTLLPWALSLSPSTHLFVSAQDVFDALYTALRTPVRQEEVDAVPHSQYSRVNAAGEAYKVRYRACVDPARRAREKAAGMRRVDFLGQTYRFGGLVLVEDVNPTKNAPPISSYNPPSLSPISLIPPCPSAPADLQDAQVLNTIDDLARGIVQTTHAKTELTLLVVGDTGTGKTAFLSLIANVLKGKTPSEYTKLHELAHEVSGSRRHGKTDAFVPYEFVSTNGVTMRILDTPGIADTRSVTRAIHDHVDTVDAVLVLANGTVPRLGVATDHALSALSALPAAPTQKVGFLFTNVSSPLCWSFDEESLPDVLGASPLFRLNNPVAMRAKYLREKKRIEAEGAPSSAQNALLSTLRAAVEDAHRSALGELVKVLDWVDSLAPPPARDDASLFAAAQEIDKTLSDVLAAIGQMVAKKAALTKIKKETHGTTLTTELYRQYQSTITQKVYRQVGTPYHNTLCTTPECYHNCHERCGLPFSLEAEGIRECSAFSCGQWELTEDKHVVVGHALDGHGTGTERNKQEMGKARLEKTIANLDTALADAAVQVGQQVGEYAKLPLSVGFAGHLRKSVALLRLNVETMRGNGTDASIIASVEKALKRMEEKFVLVEAGKGRRGAKAVEQEEAPRQLIILESLAPPPIWYFYSQSM
ncbi:uncharacterized protein FIBRA_07729 [Fibroporia radiculosa]|uniref:DUF6699 domain-containing protein n=1 Tax=Fibroporia radiculosa TaxID=599839 RepID=J4IBZ2_9APHY|nr:uncharacterized protein FIBRA_07729 [Fibroporia radiculosa]CCM05506.1 predicted protein [Fibroporia radiculosa]